MIFHGHGIQITLRDSDGREETFSVEGGALVPVDQQSTATTAKTTSEEFEVTRWSSSPPRRSGRYTYPAPRGRRGR